MKRAYEQPRRSDGPRVLVDRLWPRGRTKAQLKIKAWLRDVGPSTQLRRWFGHDPLRWTEFRKRYKRELATAAQRNRLRALLGYAHRGKLTLVYGAKDERHNQAVVLKEVLSRFSPGTVKRVVP